MKNPVNSFAVVSCAVMACAVAAFGATIPIGPIPETLTPASSVDTSIHPVTPGKF